MAFANVTASHHRKTNRSLHGTKVADYLRTMRVVSLVPSWTEFLHDVEVIVVGQTKFCVRPPEAYRTVARVGGTKTVDLQRVMDLEPDVVVANREENDRDQVTALATALPDASVLLTDVRTVEDAWTEMRRLGRALNRPSKVNDLVDRIQTRWGAARPEAGKAGYAVWAKPWMAAGQDTFIHSVMAHWGIGNAIGAHASSDRYPTLGEDFTEGARGADVWLLPSEPFPFKDKHLSPILAHHPETKCMLVDGEAFSWYGSRMAHVADHLRDVAHWVAKANG